MKKEETIENPFPPAIKRIHKGHGKNVLVLMSAGIKYGNTDQLTCDTLAMASPLYLEQ